MFKEQWSKVTKMTAQQFLKEQESKDLLKKLRVLAMKPGQEGQYRAVI